MKEMCKQIVLPIAILVFAIFCSVFFPKMFSDKNVDKTMGSVQTVLGPPQIYSSDVDTSILSRFQLLNIAEIPFIPVPELRGYSAEEAIAQALTELDFYALKEALADLPTPTNRDDFYFFQAYVAVSQFDPQNSTGFWELQFSTDNGDGTILLDVNSGRIMAIDIVDESMDMANFSIVQFVEAWETYHDIIYAGNGKEDLVVSEETTSGDIWDYIDYLPFTDMYSNEGICQLSMGESHFQFGGFSFFSSYVRLGRGSYEQ